MFNILVPVLLVVLVGVVIVATRRGHMRTDDRFYLVAGGVHFVVALVFGMSQTVFVTASGGGTVPNIVAGVAAAGFAVGGGLCFLAAAIVQGKGDRSRRPDVPPTQLMDSSESPVHPPAT